MSLIQNRRLLARLLWTVPVLAIVLLALGAIAPAQHPDSPPQPEHFAGIINDYSPSNVPGGPWEVRGKWSLDLHGDSGNVNFTADLTMETSDYGVTTGSIKDPTKSADRTPHTHRITMTQAMITHDPSACVTSAAPTKPVTTGPVIVITGPISVTGNGQPAPFETMGPSSLQICLTGGTVIPYSNFTMTFSGSATTHFGSQPFSGVIINKTSDHDHGLPMQ